MLKLPLEFLRAITSEGLILQACVSNDEDVLKPFMAILVHIKREGTYLYILDMYSFIKVSCYDVGYNDNYVMDYFGTDYITVLHKVNRLDYEQYFSLSNSLINMSYINLMSNELKHKINEESYIKYMNTLGKCYEIYNTLDNVHYDLGDNLESLISSTYNISNNLTLPVINTQGKVEEVIKHLEERYGLLVLGSNNA